LAGEILKKKREDLGRDIREIADLLKINAAYLAAIENDSFSELPALVYTMGYIRCYARYLDVDAESIIEYYTKNLSQPKPSTIIPIAFSQKKVPRIYYVMLFGVCALAVFFYVSHGRTKPKETAKVPPGSARVVRTVLPRTSRPPAVKEHNSTGEHRLEIAATATTWISIKFADGRSEEMLLEPGNSRGIRFSDKALLKVGNAGGIRVRMDEKDLGIPGNLGQVITLPLPPE
jgi:transcriptional regulator with XRE-family HTH domain